MLKPALLYKEELERKFAEVIYTDEYFWYSGYPYAHQLPSIETIDNVFQWAVVKSTDEVIGYLSYRVYPETDCVSNFGLFGFNGSPLVGKDVFEHLEMLVKEHRRVEWRMTGGNPVFKHYKKFCEQHHGNYVVLHDVEKDNHGKYHDDYIFEILRDKDLEDNSRSSGEHLEEHISVEELYNGDPIPKDINSFKLKDAIGKIPELKAMDTITISGCTITIPSCGSHFKGYDSIDLIQYENFSWMSKYIIGASIIREGTSIAFSATIIESNTNNIVGTLVRWCTTTDFVANCLLQLIEKILPNSILCIEQTHDGGEIVDKLKSMGLDTQLYCHQGGIRYGYSRPETFDIRFQMLRLLIREIKDHAQLTPQMIKDLKDAKIRNGVLMGKDLEHSQLGIYIKSYMQALYACHEYVD